MEHECKVLNNLEAAQYGPAVASIYLRDDGNWSMENGEYESYPIYFCPCCGVNLQDQVNKITGELE